MAYFVLIGLIAYIAIAGLLYGVEVYLCEKHWVSAPVRDNAGMVVIAIFWPLCFSFYLGGYIAKKKVNG